MDKFSNISAAFQRIGNDSRAIQMAAYMRDQFLFFGIPSPQRRAVYKDLILRDKKAGKPDWLFLDKCWDDEHREFQYLVLDYLVGMQRFLSFEDVPRLERYVRSRQWWDTIDGLDRIIGNIGLSDGRISDLMLEWAEDDNFWVRRVAIDHQLLRKERTDTALLEKILIKNFGSREFFINKAIGWSLRDYSKTDPEWVKGFIDRYRDRLSPLSIREGSKYL